MAVDLDGKKREARIYLAAPLDITEVEQDLATLITESEEALWDDQRGRVIARRLRKLGELVLEDWLLPFLNGMQSWADLSQLKLTDILNSQLTYQKQQQLKSLAPVALTIPTGQKILLDYTVEGGPVVAAKLQAFMYEVRSNIDSIDREIVGLLAERGGFVKQAAGFKKTTDDVKAPQRVEQVITKVKTLAAELGGNSEVTEAVYRAMISAFISAELQEHAEHAELASSR